MDNTKWDNYILHLFLVLFYTDNAYLACQNHRMLQEALDILVVLFNPVGLLTNTTKSQFIIDIPGKILIRLSQSSYSRQYGGLQSAAKWSARAMDCDVCGDKLVESSLKSHLMTQHGVTQAQEVDLAELKEQEG